ncbi:uncharacterized protein LOC134546198 [Bacillus rossius redtenbacheri]|uniref:uncharacterized protein LOC134546198 n=1 Tax=Bacillus rossius redtenbacheri TaxID=93214 RepID=UPI002FDCDE11
MNLPNWTDETLHVQEDELVADHRRTTWQDISDSNSIGAAAAGRERPGGADGAPAVPRGRGEVRRAAQHQVVPRLVSHLRVQRQGRHLALRGRLRQPGGAALRAQRHHGGAGGEAARHPRRGRVQVRDHVHRGARGLRRRAVHQPHRPQ